VVNPACDRSAERIPSGIRVTLPERSDRVAAGSSHIKQSEALRLSTNCKSPTKLVDKFGVSHDAKCMIALRQREDIAPSWTDSRTC
jgi:hypothetical protein